MKNNYLNSVKNRVKYWWISLLVGALAIILGIWCFAAPATTLALLSAFFIAGFFISGIFDIAFALTNRNCLKGWGWTLASGIISVILSIVLLLTPLDTILVLIFFAGFWIMFQSIWGIGVSVSMQQSGVKGWGWILALAILGFILSIILVTNPLFASAFMVAIFAITLISYGILRIIYSIRLKSVYNEIEDIDKDNRFE